jgi:hypothetical protein
MFTLDELISNLQSLRKKTGEKDVPVRIVIRDGRDGLQFTVQDADLIDLRTKEIKDPLQEQYMVLVYAGDSMATMDWPMDPEEFNRRLGEE